MTSPRFADWWKPESPHTEAPQPAETAMPADRAAQPVQAFVGRSPSTAAVDFGTTSSTVTMFDLGQLSYTAMSAQQRAVQAAEIAALLRRDLDTGLPSEWPPLITEIAGRLLADDPVVRSGADPVQRLAELVTPAPDSRSSHLDSVLAELERARNSRSGLLRRFLSQQLLQCYEKAFQEPPLDLLRLFKVRLEAPNREELDSTVYVTDNGQRSFSLVHPTDTAEGNTTTSYRGLKQQLGRRSPRVGTGDDPELEELIGGALGDLVGRTNRYLDAFRQELGFAAGELNSVVVTYPTMVPLSVRDMLGSILLEQGVARVVTRYDEAIAAAMFVVMRELGGSFDPSVEAFAARSHPNPHSINEFGRPTEWTQHVLIIDIGGGTTDIALLRLELRDETVRKDEKSKSAHYGRYYRLVPTVLGTTGETQRGGDFLTLQVFRWIKILLADHLLTTSTADFDPEIRQLDAALKDEHGKYLPGRLAQLGPLNLDQLRKFRREADLVIPTTWKNVADEHEASNRRQTFEAIWELAERVKRELGAGTDFPLEEEHVRDVLRQVWQQRTHVGGESGQQASGLSRADSRPPAFPSTTLPHSQFEQLVRAEVADLMRLAASLVREKLVIEAQHPLDRVIFTGRGSRLRLAGEQLRAVFAEEAATQSGKRIDWNPGAVAAVDDYAKHAASIGACWADSVNQLVKDQHNVRDQLEEGVVWLKIDVENLFFFLRGTFETPGQVSGGSAGGTTLFSAGARLRRLHPSAGLTIRSDKWLQYSGLFGVQRRKIAEELIGNSARKGTINWCFFRTEDYLQKNEEPGFKLTQEMTKQLCVLVEATAGLDMDALLCHGDKPHHLVPAKQVNGRPTTASVLDVWEPTGQRPASFTELPFDIVVNPKVPGAMSDAMVRPVFKAGSADTLFTSYLVSADEPDRPIRAVISEPLTPEPSGWSFFLRRPVTGAEAPFKDDLITTLTVDDPDSAVTAAHDRYSVPCYASLDEEGNLRVHVGMPPFREATTMRGVFDTPGSVLRVRMSPGEPDYVEDDDPFTGMQ